MNDYANIIEILERIVGKVQTRVLIETTETNIFRRRSLAIKAHCDQCGRVVTMLTRNEAARITGEGPRRIRFLMNSAGLHYALDETGKPFICLFSLSSIQ